jgi:hypothetical protein
VGGGGEGWEVEVEGGELVDLERWSWRGGGGDVVRDVEKMIPFVE